MTGTEMKRRKSMSCLEDFIHLGRFHLLLALTMEFVIIAELSNMAFMLFGGAVPTILSCGDIHFENVTDKKAVCKHLNSLRVNGSLNCTPVVSEAFQSINAEWGIFCDGEKSTHDSLSYQMLGVLFGALIFGQISDCFGRKWTSIISLICLLASGAASARCSTIEVFMYLRFVVGFFLGGEMTVLYVFFIEMVPKKHRFWLKTLLSWSPSYVIFASAAYLTHNWRLFAVVSNVLALPGVVLLLFFTESPHWLIQRGKRRQAEEALKSIARINGRIIDEAELSAVVDKEIALNRERIESGQRYCFHHLFYTWKLTAYTAAMMIAWFTASCISYGLLFSLGALSGSLYLNAVLYGLVRYAASIVIALLDYTVEWIGRKAVQTFCLSVIIASFSVIFTGLLFEVSVEYAQVIRIASLCAAAMTSPLWLLAYLATAEAYPTSIRNLSNAYSSMWSRIAGIVAPQILYTADIWTPAPYLILIIMAAVDLLAFALLLPETKGKPLPEHMPGPEKFILRSCPCRGRRSSWDGGAETERSGSFAIYKFTENGPIAQNQSRFN